MSAHILETSGIGHAINKLRRDCSDAEVQSLAKSVTKKWRRIVKAEMAQELPASEVAKKRARPDPAPPGASGGNGAPLRTWEKNFNLTSKDYTLPSFVVAFEAEIKMLTTILLNLDCYKPICQHFWRYKRDLAKEEHERKHMKNGKMPKNAPQFDADDFNLHDGQKMSAVLQEAERLILEEAMRFAREQGVAVTSYCYDGFQALKQGFPPDFISNLNEHIQSIDLGSRVKFIIKPFKTPLDLKDIKDSVRFDMREFEMIDTYDAKKAYFEKFHFKCIDPPCYVKMNKNSQQLITLNAFSKIYNNLTIPSPPECPFPRSSFISKWNADPDMRTYDLMDVLPPPLACPDYIFNGWVDFPIKEVPLDPAADTSRIYRHLDYTSNHNPLVKEYLLNWFAQMVQFPAFKSRVAVLLQGEPGAGKSVVAEKLMEKILGSLRRVRSLDCSRASCISSTCAIAARWSVVCM